LRRPSHLPPGLATILPTLIGNHAPTRLQYNSRLAPDVTSFSTAEDSAYGSHRLLHPSAKLATNFWLPPAAAFWLAPAACLRSPPFVESFGCSSTGFPACAGSPMTQPSRTPESHRMLVLGLARLSPPACADEPSAQACGELSAFVRPCIVSCAADEYPTSAVDCTSGSPAADPAACTARHFHRLHQRPDLSALANLSSSGSACDQPSSLRWGLNLIAWLAS